MTNLHPSCTVLQVFRFTTSVKCFHEIVCGADTRRFLTEYHALSMVSVRPLALTSDLETPNKWNWVCIRSNQKWGTMKLNRAIAICTCLLSCTLSSLARASEVRLTADSTIPAAVGKANLNKEKNGNLKLKVGVHHLAKPGALTPARQTYVVWTQARGKDPQNQGVLKVNDKLEGTFENTVSNQDFDVFITAEDNPKAEFPSEPKLLKGTMQP